MTARWPITRAATEWLDAATERLRRQGGNWRQGLLPMDDDEPEPCESCDGLGSRHCCDHGCDRCDYAGERDCSACDGTGEAR